mmetsp:Transcript_30181/g.65163  ORF Transcript_30181/g.65163 Transcript_30181/m.65163 type:complete len:1030 (+) Transcript_30181:308-3397(+)
MKFNSAIASISTATILAATTAVVLLDGASAVNFVIIQPDDMHFYDEWNPPPYLPWGGNNYPGQEYPGTSDLPWINKLRTEGLTMTQAYAAAPKCGTSRYSTVTGRYPTRSSHSRAKAINAGKDATIPADASIPNTKLRDVGNVDDGSDCTHSNIAQTFKGAGYETGMVGKWHLTKNNLVTGDDGDVYGGVKAEIERCGFMDVEAMYPDNLDESGNQAWSTGLSHNMEYVAYKAVEFITDNAAKDWFLYVNPTVPHGPGVEDAMDVDCRITTDGDFTTHMENGWSVEGMTAEFGDNCTAYREDVKERASQSDSNDDLGAIWVDDAIGAIYQALNNTNQLGDTLILFQLDHGKAEKDKIWEGGIRIPQFIHYPDGIADTPRDWSGLVSTIDIGPTMLDFAGISPSYDMDGKSWKNAIDPINGSEDDWKNNRCLFFESSDDRAVRCGCDKYMLLGSDASPEVTEAVASDWWTGTEALFDLCDAENDYVVADSSTESPEATNLLEDEPQKAEDLKSLLQCHLGRTDATISPLYEECTGSVATPSPTATPKPTLPVANNGGVPELIEYFPWQYDILPLASNTVLSATVLDDNIKRVRFNLQYPDGTRLGFAAGTQDSVSGDLTTYTRTVDTSSQSGKYGFKLEIQDNSDDIETVCFPADCSSWIEFVVADTAAQVVTAARAEISDIILRNNPDVNLAAKFVRHGFHDCVGGCDGCVDMSNPDNAGLDVPIEALEPVVDIFTHFGVTRADIWVLAALEGSSITQEDGDPDNRDFEMDWIGRPNCEDLNEPADCVDETCNHIRGPNRNLPSPNLDTHDLLEFFSNEFGFSDRDTVAIMGAHSLGGLQRENSGFNGVNGWVGNTRLLANDYYDSIVGATASLADCDTSANSVDDCVNDLKNSNRWEQVFVENSEPEFSTPDRWEWERGTNPDHFVMVNSDIALVRDLNGLMTDDGEVSTCQWKCNRNNCALPACPHAPETIGVAAEYASDNGLFLEDFESAFKTMLAHGQYDTSAGCASPPCTVGAEARRNLRGPSN